MNSEELLKRVAKDYRSSDWRKLAAVDVANWVTSQPKPITLNPRLVLEWATGHKWEDVDAARKRNTELGESASCDLLNGYRWLSQIMDWVATHMEINNSICFRCADRTVVGLWEDFPLCERCMKDMKSQKAQAEIENLPKHVEDVKAHLAAVFGKIKVTPKSHNEVCKERRKRHTYFVKTPAGYVLHDLGLTPNQGDAQMWTKSELELFVKPPFEDAETPIEIFRVVR